MDGKNLNAIKSTSFMPVWNRAPFRQRSLADRVNLNNRNDKRTKENGVSLWRMAYTDSTRGFMDKCRVHSTIILLISLGSPYYHILTVVTKRPRLKDF